MAEVQNLEQLRVEGMLQDHNLRQVSQMKANGRPVKVIVEAAPQVGAMQELLGHLQPVRAVAVTKDPKHPLIISAGEDKTVRVWDRLEGGRRPSCRTRSPCEPWLARRSAGKAICV